MLKTFKYPRTPHLPWSPGFSSDDIIGTADWLPGTQVVISEKMDGENTTMYHFTNGYHARSMDGRHHPSQTYCKALQAKICNDIPKGWRICGENLFARHSIPYENLESYFQVFSIWNEENICLSYEETVTWTELLGIKMTPLIWKGEWPKEKTKEKAFIEQLENSDINKHEGYVIRVANQFKFEDFKSSIAKWVRKNHVQTDEHWKSKPIIPNTIKPA